MKRREFITLIGGAAAAWPLAARAQQPKVPVIGFLSSEFSDGYASRLNAFRQGLTETGYVEGSNVAIEYRWAEGRSDRLAALAADLVRRPVSAIFANGPAVVAAKAATTTVPIVFAFGSDPVQAGLVAGLNRPGGNITGITNLNGELGPKRLELLHELLPTATVISVLRNPTNPNAERQWQDLQAGSRSLGLQLRVLDASAERELDPIFATLAQAREGGLVITNDAFFFGRIARLAALTVRYAVPTIYVDRDFAASGGLMSYGGTNANAVRLAGVYIGRILKGEKPGDLPVQQGTNVELVINLKTAKTLGLTVPLPLLTRADEVIE